MNAKNLNYILIIVVLVLVVLMRNGCHSKKSQKNFYDTAQDSLKFAIDELGRQKATIGALKGENRVMLLNMETKDSTVEWLQGVVKDYKGKLKTAIVVSNVTDSREVVRTVHVESVDTIIKDSIKYVYPEYSIDWVNEWEKGVIVANKDSIYRDIQFTNEFEITLGEQRNKWFKPREFLVNVRNMNPMTQTKELKSFSVKSKPKRFVLALHLGGGIDFLTLKPTFYAGVGIGFVLVEIK